MRKVEKDDLQMVFQLVKEGRSTWPIIPSETLEDFQRRMKNQSMWLTEREDGFLSWLPELDSPHPREEAEEGDIHLSSFFVKRESWGSGLSGEMMEFVFSSTKGSHLRLWTPSEAPRARAFYKKMGFREGREVLIAGMLKTEYLR